MSIDAETVVKRSGLDGFDLPVAGVAIVPMPTIAQKILGRHVQAITLVRRVYVNQAHIDSLVAGSERELLAHELTHVAQWEDHGMAGFTWDYVRDYLRLRLLGATHHAAYRSIGLELQAYSGAREIVESLE